MGEMLESVAKVVLNPALRGKEATQDGLREMEPVILRSAIRQCEGFVRSGGVSMKGRLCPWSKNSSVDIKLR